MKWLRAKKKFNIQNQKKNFINIFCNHKDYKRIEHLQKKKKKKKTTKLPHLLGNYKKKLPSWQLQKKIAFLVITKKLPSWQLAKKKNATSPSWQL